MTHEKKQHSLLYKLAKVSLITTATLTTATGVGVFGTYKYLQKQAQQRRQNTQTATIMAKPYKGRIQKVGNHISFTNQSATYSINDPMSITDTLAKQANITMTNDNQVLDFQTEFLAELSPKGNYGKLGQHEYQLTIIDKL
ncbi:hypothetical protein ACGTJS_05945 [Faucicola mancuniensis]|uniref:hypothetical protein n=1 Tax=Faucicola mancuniensis TaxID=1309795 RepID=UPI0039779D46